MDARARGDSLKMVARAVANANGASRVVRVTTSDVRVMARGRFDLAVYLRRKRRFTGL